MNPRRLFLPILALVVASLVPAVTEAACRKCTYVWFHGWYCLDDEDGWTKCITAEDHHICRDSGADEDSIRCGVLDDFPEKTPSPFVVLEPGVETSEAAPTGVDGRSAEPRGETR